jgi:hypothetical protein
MNARRQLIGQEGTRDALLCLPPPLLLLLLLYCSQVWGTLCFHAQRYG